MEIFIFIPFFSLASYSFHGAKLKKNKRMVVYAEWSMINIIISYIDCNLLAVNIGYY